MKKKWIVTLSIILLLANPLTLYATQNSPSDTQGDAGVTIIEDFETVHSDITPAKVTAELEVPQGFGQSCYVTLMDEEGNSYRISCTEENDYMSSIYLAEGTYFVDYAGVYGDNISQYAFDYIPEQVIEAKSGEPNVLHYRMKNYEDVQNQIEENQERLDELTGGAKSETEENTQEEEMLFFPSGIEGILVEAGGGTYYEVTHNGSTKTTCVVSGNAISDADVVLRVTKAGVIGEAVVELSKDGGATYDASAVISDTLYIGTLGVNVSFLMQNDAEQFVVGDTFSFKVRENFRVIYNSPMHSGYVTIFGHPMEDKKLYIHMLSSGGRGESRFTVSFDGGMTVALQDIVPEDGKYLMDDNITLIFSDHDFAKGLEYTAEITSNDTTINWIPVLLLCILLAVLVTAAYVYLMLQKDKPNEYKLMTYKQMREEKHYE